MDLEGIMLSEVTQRKTNTAYSHLYTESKKTQNPKKIPRKKNPIALKQAQRHRRDW